DCMPRSRIENRVTQELKRVTMKLVCAGFRDHVHHSARVLTILCTVVARLDAEFLQCVRHWKWLVDVRVFVKVVAAIKLIACLVLARTICHHRDCTRKRLCCSLESAAPKGACRTCRVCRVAERTRYKQTQLCRVTAIEWQLRNTSLLDNLFQRRSSRVD